MNRTHLFTYSSQSRWADLALIPKKSTRPSTLVVLGDARESAGTHWKYIECPVDRNWLDKSSTATTSVAFRHNGTGNVLYLDGHVVSRKWDELYIPYKCSQSIWETLNGNPWNHGDQL